MDTLVLHKTKKNCHTGVVAMEYLNDEKILLILDLDETLIYASHEALERKADFQLAHYHVYKRPFLKEFIEKVKEDFLLAIWSSASDDYVEAIVQQILTEEVQLEFVWGRSRCTYRRKQEWDELRYYSWDYSNHYYYVKSLKKLKRKGYDIKRILIVDDTPHKSERNYGNAIYPKEFTGDPNDDELKLLAKYLPLLKDEENVRTIEKRNWRSKIKSIKED